MKRQTKIWLTSVAMILLIGPAPAQDSFTYDDLGRLIQVDYDDGQVTKYHYDAAGNRTLVEQGGAPDPQDDVSITAEETAKDINVLGNDTDLNGDTLTIVSVTTPANGATQIIQVAGDDWIRYTPNANFNQTDNFSYTVTDGITQVSADVSVEVTNTNDSPVATDDTGSTNEDVNLTISPLGNDTDPDSDPLSIGSVTQPTNGTATIVGATIVYAPDPDYFGNDSFTYEASDGTLSDTGTVTVTVNAVNDDPVASNDAFTKAEDTPHTFDPRGNDSDPEGDALTVASVSNPPNGTATRTSTSITYTPDAHFHGADSFTYTLSDGNGGTDTATVNVTITSVEDAPIAVNDTKSTNEDVALTFDPRSNDLEPDGQTLTITAKTNPSSGFLSIVNGGTQLKYTPVTNWTGSTSFTYTVSDGALTDTATVNMTVNPVNDPPNAVDNYFTNVNKLVWTVLSVLGNDTDPEGDTLTITAVNGGPAQVQIWNNGTQVRYKCNTGGCGSSSDFSYTISDGNGGTDFAYGYVTHQSGGGGGGGGGPEP